MKDKKVSAALLLNVFSFLVIFLLGVIILPKNALAGTSQEPQSSLNSFYISVINNVLSETKLGNKEKNNSSASSMKITVLSFLGIDISNPISIITKEIAYLDKNDGSSSVNNQVNNEGDDINTIIPFKLIDNQVNKSDIPTVVSNSINNDLRQTLNKLHPRVLIYHSHTTESYKASGSDTTKNFFNPNESLNVVGVGDVIASQLETKYGISVIHDKTVNNIPDYNSSYKNSGINLARYLKKYGDFDLIIDLHRDAVPGTSTKVTKTKINGEDAANFMFVVTRQNPRYAKQIKLVNSMVGISNKLFPNLIKPQEIKYADWGWDFYNQNRSDYATLVEVGDNNNTIAQVKNTGMYLSRIFAEQLNGKK